MTDFEQVKISIIVAVYNGVKTLQRCIDSVAKQTYQNIELIIMDGGSTDGTVELIQANRDKIAYWESKPDNGIAHAWNKALNKLTGDWFIVLGADDYLNNENVLSSFIQSLPECGESLIVYGEVNRVNTKGDVIERNDGAPWSLKRFLSRPMYVCHQSIFCHSSLIEKVGTFDESLRIAIDYDYIFRCLKYTTPYYVEGLVVSDFALGGVSGSTKDILKMYREFMHVKSKNGYKKVQGYFYFMMAKVWVKYFLECAFGSRVRRFTVDCYRIITGRRPTKRP